jgi:nucleotide-binding universal stress UspA family protein
MSDHQDTIICATDFSDTCDHALDWAAAVARRWNAHIELLYVMPPPSTSLEALVTDLGVMEGAAHAAAVERLELVARNAEVPLGVQIRARVLQGEPPAVICEVAAETQAMMIVLGSHGRSAVGRWILGSVADRTVRVADRPVAVIPPPRESRDQVVAAMRDTERPLRVLAGIDLQPTAARVITFVSELKRRQPCDVTFIHFYWPQEEIERLGLQGPRNLLETDPEVATNLEPRLRRALGPLSANPRVKLAIRPAWGEPAANLLVAAQESDADLIVIGAEERHGLSRLMHPSVASSLGHQPHHYVPVIYLPAPRRKAAEADASPRIPLFLTILAPTDLSPAGNRAVGYAYSLLRARPGVVELCYVHEHVLPNPPYAYDDVPGRLTPARRAAIDRELRALVPAAAEGFGITTHVSIIDGGAAAKAIVQAAERFNVDVISMGSHGRSGIARVLLGSVTEEVTRHAGKPVLVVRETH